MARKVTHMSLEGGVLFFEDGTEVSGVSVEMIKALPDLLDITRQTLKSLAVLSPATHDGLLGGKMRAAIFKATGEEGGV